MDESVDLFKAEQRRLADQGQPAAVFRRQLVSTLSSYGIFFATIWGLAAFLGLFPRNADHSMKLIVYGPILGVLGIAAAILLRKPPFRRAPFRLTLWSLVVMAAVALPVGLIDAAVRAGDSAPMRAP